MIRNKITKMLKKAEKAHKTFDRMEDMLLLFTDGIAETESAVGDQFGQERVLEIAREHRSESSHAIIQYICTAAREYARGQDQQDDMTIVVCKVGQ